MPFKFSSFGNQSQEQFPEMEQSLSSRALELVTTPVVGILEALDYPGSTLRGLLSGKGLSSFTEKTTGRDFLNAQGLEDLEWSPGGIDVPGLAAEFIDPTLFVGAGLTKAGKVAKVAAEAQKEIPILKKFIKAAVNDKRSLKIAKEILKEKESKVKVFQGAIDIFPESKVEQVARGLKGFTLKVPFTDIESAPIRGISRLMEKVPDITLPKKIKNLFSTESDTPAGKVLKEVNKRSLADRQLAQRKLTAEIEDATKSFNPEQKRQFNEDVVNTAMAIGQPERIREHLKTFDEETNKLIQIEREKIDKEYLPKLNKAKTDKEKADLTLKYAEKINKKIGKIQSNRLELHRSLHEKMGIYARQLNVVAPTGSLPREFAEKLYEAGVNTFELEKVNRLAIKQLDDWSAYVPYVLSAEGKELFAKDPAFKKTVKGGIVSLAGFAEKRRLKGFTSITELNDYIKKEYGLDKAFIVDPVLIREHREWGSQLAINKALDIQTLVYLSMKKMPKIKAKGRIERQMLIRERNKALVPLEEVLKNTKMSSISIPVGRRTVEVEWDNALVWGKSGKKGEKYQKLRDVFEKAGVVGKGERLYVPRDLIDDVFKKQEEFVKGFDNFTKVWDFVNSAFRTYLTSFHPSHIGTNTVGNTLMNVISVGPMAMVRDYPMAIKSVIKYLGFEDKINSHFFRSLGRDLETGKFTGGKPDEGANWLKEYITHVAGGDTFLNTIKTDFKELFEKTVKTRNQKIEKAVLDNIAIRTGQKINNFSENVAKIAHYISRRKAGFSPSEASESVKKYLFDYSDLTNFEKRVMRRSVLFYTFTRKNLPLAIAETFSNQKAYALGKASLATLRSKDFVPAYVRDTGSIAFGEDQFADIKNPLFEANRFGSQGGGVQRVIDRGVASLVPQLKIPYELLTGRETFRSRPLEELNRVSGPGASILDTIGLADKFTDRAGKEVTVANPYLLQAIRNLPSSRIQQTVSDITNIDINPLSILGPRIRHLPLEERRNKVLQEMIERELRGRPDVKQFKRFFSIEKEGNKRSQELIEALRAINEK